MIETEEYVSLISLSWDQAIISFSLPCMSKVRVDCILPEQRVLAETIEENTLGRICLTALQPGTEHKVRVSWEQGRRDIEFVTFAEPVGPCLSSYAVVGDPHISEKPENRKGRLFVESAMILRDMVEQFNDAELDFVLIAGDVTNFGTAGEYAVARDVLDKLNCPLLAVPGDHDVDDGARKRWAPSFGPAQWSKNCKDLCLIGLDSSSGVLGTDGLDWIARHLQGPQRLNVIVTHLQLIPDGYIVAPKQKTVTDYEQHRKALEKLFKNPTVIYVGHQNVPSKVQVHQSVQVNVPQASQFPCGYLLVRQYANGLYHMFVPITSEVLRDYSRVASNLAEKHFGEAHWNDKYRMGRDIGESNFVFSFKDRISACPAC